MKKILYCLSSLLVVLAGCSVDELNMFDADKIYIEFGDDEFETSFINTPGEDVAVYDLEIFMHGLLQDEPVDIVISVDTASTAIEGVHYKLEDSYTMAAGVTTSTIPITTMRTDAMDSITYKLVLNMESTEKAIKGDIKQTTLYIDNQVVQPSWWTTTSVIYQNLLGKYSKKKYEYFIVATGVIDLEGMAYIDLLELTLQYKEWLDAQDPYPVDEYGSEIELKI